MLEDRPVRKLYYSERVGNERTHYLLCRGSEVVGYLRSKGEAELVCYNNQEMRRLASDRTNDIRRHQAELKRLQQEIDTLVDTLRKVTAALRQGKERDLLTVKEEAKAVLRKFNTVSTGNP